MPLWKGTAVVVHDSQQQYRMLIANETNECRRALYMDGVSILYSGIRKKWNRMNCEFVTAFFGACLVWVGVVNGSNLRLHLFPETWQWKIKEVEMTGSGQNIRVMGALLSVSHTKSVGWKATKGWTGAWMSKNTCKGIKMQIWAIRLNYLL